MPFSSEQFQTAWANKSVSVHKCAHLVLAREKARGNYILPDLDAKALVAEAFMWAFAKASECESTFAARSTGDGVRALDAKKLAKDAFKRLMKKTPRWLHIDSFSRLSDDQAPLDYGPHILSNPEHLFLERERQRCMSEEVDFISKNVKMNASERGAWAYRASRGKPEGLEQMWERLNVTDNAQRAVNDNIPSATRRKRLQKLCARARELYGPDGSERFRRLFQRGDDKRRTVGRRKVFAALALIIAALTFFAATLVTPSSSTISTTANMTDENEHNVPAPNSADGTPTGSQIGILAQQNRVEPDLQSGGPELLLAQQNRVEPGLQSGGPELLLAQQNRAEPGLQSGGAEHFYA